MRQENVLNVLRSSTKMYGSDFKDRFTKDIIGSIVLTDYNNRTYRIDDIDWNQSPMAKFSKADGTEISYVEYYKQRYGINITERKQPLLVSRAKKNELRAGMAEILYLVPELCRMTGLTENERNNMNMMRELAKYTRLNPAGRIQKLQNFSHRMRTNKKIVDELRKWDMELAERIIDLPGRILPRETIMQGAKGNVKFTVGEDADWTKSLRSNSMLTLGEIKVWVVVCVSNLKNDCIPFVKTLIDVARGNIFF